MSIAATRAVRRTPLAGRITFALALLLCASLAVAATPPWVSREWTVMTTRAYLEFYPEDADPARTRAIFSAVADEFTRVEMTFSPWVEFSELALVNRSAADAPVQVSPEMFAMFQAAGQFHALTHGAFDASFAGAGKLYDYRAGVAPDAKALAAAQQVVGWQYVKLDESAQTVRYAKPGVRVDFGGIAKGYAIDRAVAILKQYGVRDAYLSLGGDSYALGIHDGRPWQVGIRHPREAAAAPVMIPASDFAISTSGDYERFFERNGERIHHILAPGTGKPAHGLVSVTVLADDGTTADALSTGVFVLGKERGLALINGLSGISAVLIDEDGNVHYSDDLAPVSAPKASAP